MERHNAARRIAGAILAIALASTVPAAAKAADAKAKPKKVAESGSAHTADARAHEKEAEAARAQALRDGWPDTPAGLVGSGWVRAFSSGEKAMRAFLGQHTTEESLEERPMEARIEGYLALRGRFGDLTLHSVVESAPDELTVWLLAEDAQPHRFVFTVEKEPPHRLLQVRMIQDGHGHGHSGHQRR